MNLSTTVRSVDGLSSSFSSNVGIDDTAVISRGPFQLGVEGFGGLDVIVRLPTAFYYDPSQGNLLLDVRNFGGGTTTWGGPPFTGLAYVDATSIVGDNVSSVSAIGVGVSEGTVTTLGLVTQFKITQIPEPSAFVMFSLGCAALCFCAYES